MPIRKALLLCTCVVMFGPVAALFGQSKAKAPETSNDSPLLHGVTPATYAPVKGWRLLFTQDWERSKVGTSPNERLSGDAAEVWTNMSVRDAFAHTGKQSLRSGEYGAGRDSKNGSGRESLTVRLPAGSSEAYVSWYERLDPFKDGVGNYFTGADWYLASFKSASSEMTLNFSGSGRGSGQPPKDGVYGFSRCWLVWQPQGCGYENVIQTGMVGADGQKNGKGLLGIKIGDCGFDGAWHQWEVYYKASTPGLKNADGALTVWRDGVLWNKYVNVNLNGMADMSRMVVQISGWWGNIIPMPKMMEKDVPPQYKTGGGYPLQNWANDLIRQYLKTGVKSPYLAVGKFVGDGFGCDTSGTGLSFKEANALAPGIAPPHTFYKYIDDVVILYKPSNADSPKEPRPAKSTGK
jgi:hypothetical protein